MKSLIETNFKKAILKEEYIYVIIDINGKEELIINRPENVQEKLNYYLNTYDDCLCLKTNGNISIKSFGHGCKEDIISEVNQYMLRRINT